MFSHCGFNLEISYYLYEYPTEADYTEMLGTRNVSHLETDLFGIFFRFWIMCIHTIRYLEDRTQI